MPLTIRAPTFNELSGLSDLCFRSKAVWGYDEKFMEACRGELSFEPRDLELTPIAVAELNGKPIGVAQVKVVDGEADLLKLFVEPSALRSGTGKALLVWATDVAKKLGATRLTIDADPDAAPFYRRMGAYDVGQAPFGSVPGRMLPKLVMNLSLRTSLQVRNCEGLRSAPGDRQGVEGAVPYDEGVAIHIGPEPCADVRKGAGEASAGECTGQPLNRERPIILGAGTVPNVEGQTHGRL